MKLIIASFSLTASIIAIVISLYQLVMAFPFIGIALWCIGMFSIVWFIVWFIMWAIKD